MQSEERRLGKVIGRPPVANGPMRTPELEEEVIASIARGETVRAILRRPGMPDSALWYRWMKADADLSQRVAHARELGFDAIAERVLEIARGGDGASREVEASARVARDKLIVETDLKLLAKWDPKRYGDRLQVEATVKEAPELSDDEIDAEISRLAAKLGVRKGN